MACKEKVAIITGAAGNGMGRSIALTLAREGISVAINYQKNSDGAQAVAAHIASNGGKAITVQGNVFVKQDCVRLVDTVVGHWGRVDICVIGPGANWNPEGLTSLNSENAIQDVHQEIAPIYNLLPPVLRDMEQRKWGRIIGIASNLDIPSPSYSYNAAKAARIAALRLAANEAWKIGVTVNTICPGPVDGFPTLDEAWAYSRHEKDCSGRGRVTPQDIAEGVAFLCSDTANYLTGCTLPYMF